MPKRTTQEEFIQRAATVHDNRFDYSKSIYAGVHSKVLIVCPVHGEFWQKGNDHLAGRECAKCGVAKRVQERTRTNDEFVEEARLIHGDKYDYRHAQYLTSSSKIRILCDKHGEFSQTASQHLAGAGCPACSRDSAAINRRHSQDQFIEMCRQVHGDRYNYNKTIYVKGIDDVVIICPVHGEFVQKAASHSKGFGCWKCGNTHPLTTETFVEKAKLVHGDVYDYSLCEYINAHTKVTIICPNHGQFSQQACIHLQGNGCSRCGFERTSKAIRLSQDTFVKRAMEAHDGRYDYSKVKYINSTTPVEIICLEHGCFMQKPCDHMNGCVGCIKCNGRYKLNTAEFVEKARLVHGDKYDYSQTTYKSNRDNIVIVCPVHGFFNQSPYVHLSGSGCAKCAGVEQLTTDEFIKRAKEIHGDKYTYDDVVYTTTDAKVSIGCRTHGDFLQTPHRHLAGQGCIICSGKKRPTTEEFITEAKRVHGDKYDYSQTKYKRRQSKVKIICPIHGAFYQRAGSHVRGQGCDACGGTKQLDTAEFIRRARVFHGNKYDYSQTQYVKANKDVSIICPQHGVFWQLPAIHMRGAGCAACVGLKQGTTEEFVAKARLVHGDKYDYGGVRYINRNTKVVIKCPKHGQWQQIPYSHLHGKGCPICNESHGERLIAKTLEDIGLKYKRQVRFDKCRLKNPLPFDFLVRVSERKGFLIEYQGRQHYEPVKWRQNMKMADAEKEFNLIVERDKAKIAFVTNIQAPMLVIPYWDKPNIKTLIEDFVKEVA